MSLSPTERFSTRVANYVRYRPSYPPEVIDLLRRECGLIPETPVADVGSGTGIFTKLLLDASAVVYAVEPNAEMRGAAEAMLGETEGFHSVAGTAEQTGLEDESVDLVTSAQAFHWFQSEAATAEFHRILRPGGTIALVWNERLTNDPFLDAYEALLQRTSADYGRVDHRQFDDTRLAPVFEPKKMQVAEFPNVQLFDLESLTGRVLSSSYVPESGPVHEAVMEGLKALFAEHAQEGAVAFRYATKVYYAPA